MYVIYIHMAACAKSSSMPFPSETSAPQVRLLVRGPVSAKCAGQSAGQVLPLVRPSGFFL